LQVWRDYDAFVEELTARFPAERAGIKAFYDECWTVGCGARCAACKGMALHCAL